MNEDIILFLKRKIESKGMTYIFISEKTGIDYQRLIQIFDQDTVISGSELLCICRTLEVGHEELMDYES